MLVLFYFNYFILFHFILFYMFLYLLSLPFLYFSIIRPLLLPTSWSRIHGTCRLDNQETHHFSIKANKHDPPLTHPIYVLPFSLPLILWRSRNGETLGTLFLFFYPFIPLYCKTDYSGKLFLFCLLYGYLDIGHLIIVFFQILLWF